MERRERDKKERAKQAMPQNTEPPMPLFGEPKRVSLSKNRELLMFRIILLYNYCISVCLYICMYSYPAIVQVKVTSTLSRVSDPTTLFNIISTIRMAPVLLVSPILVRRRCDRRRRCHNNSSPAHSRGELVDI